MIKILPGDPRGPAKRLLEQSHALMESLYPAEANHYLSVDALCVPEVTFLIALRGEAVLGCGAVKDFGTYGELKSIYVEEGARGSGIGDALMRALEDAARERGLCALKLETGNTLYAAHTLYQRHGFTECGPFGDYGPEPLSIFMEKAL